MPDLESGLSPNRTTALELRDERHLVREGYEFLDEKRVLLATEILRRLALYQRQQSEWLQRYAQARTTLTEAIAALGVDGVQLHPVARRELALADVRLRIAGVTLRSLEAVALAPAERPAPPPIWPSAAICASAAAFTELVEQAARVAAEAQNLRRLAREYVRTDRRARAIENVLLPELDDALRFVDDQLEYLDAEEALRVHEAHRRQLAEAAGARPAGPGP